MTTIGLLPLARATFDVDFAQECLTRALADLEATGHDLVGARELLFDTEATRAALDEVRAARPDLVLVLQVTFTDAGMIAEIAETTDASLAIWAFPEPRLGGRLRLNAFCGLNLAGHALGLRDIAFSWSFHAPGSTGSPARLEALLAGAARTAPVPLRAARDTADAAARRAVAKLKGKRIARLGAHPDGFDTCAYDAPEIERVAGVSVAALELDALFDTARAAPADASAALKTELATTTQALDAVDPSELDRSLRLKGALDRLTSEGGYNAFAVRCWPECFTEYGGAVCGPVALMGEARIPCACEADVHGALTSLLLQEIADAPTFLVDLVDIDTGDGKDSGTGVVWHCGQAPRVMADPEVAIEATVHSNRKMPLLFEFPLKAGRVTLARLSRARGRLQMVVITGEMLKRDKAFTGTSGVLRFDAPAQEIMRTILDAGLEHHMALVYGDYAEALERAADALALPVLRVPDRPS
ncbi:hypothetical protein [Stappia sp.]|uniref:L-fucose/L-arabinose isomerase family protein n=1 Tax=Stappia sp. TaxID=1870903 RepID=UPI0032D9A434